MTGEPAPCSWPGRRTRTTGGRTPRGEFRSELSGLRGEFRSELHAELAKVSSELLANHRQVMFGPVGAIAANAGVVWGALSFAS